MQKLSLYFHIPFCYRRCNYCDFNTYAGEELRIPEYISALEGEMEISSENDLKEIVHTLYFGGGTPSLIPVDYYRRIIIKVKNQFQINDFPEISIEVNPGTINHDYLKSLFITGFNRLSIGMQSVNPEELALLGRIHSVKDTIESVKLAKQAGFQNVSLDLIFGLPGQKLKQWQKSLEFAVSLNVQHLSLYALTIEMQTAFSRWLRKGIIKPIDDDLAADMYEWSIDYLGKNGYAQYEISNWSRIEDGKMKFQSLHNMQYWLELPYLGFGAGAHSHYHHYRFENPYSIGDYINSVNHIHSNEPSNLHGNRVLIDKKAEMNEVMMLGLRLTDQGVSQKRFIERFGFGMQEVFDNRIEKLINLGLLEWKDSEKSTLRLTQRGKLMGNQVFMQFVE